MEEIRVNNTAQPEADGTLVILEGWAEESDSAKVDALLAEYPNLIFLKSTPTPEDNTPVKLRNRPFAHLFEVIGAMYALPKYGTIDLTRFFAPFYMIFFGFCMAEGGYGLVIMLGGLAAVMLGRKKGSSAMKEIGMLTMLCGFSGMVFGLMSGFCWGLTTISMRATTMNEAPASQMLFCQLASGFAVLLPCALLFGQTHIGLTPLMLSSMGFQTFVVAFASYLVWCQLLKQYLAARLGILVFMTPLFGVLFSVFILGDRIGLPFVAGSLLVLAGLFMVQTKHIGLVRRRRRMSAQADK